MASKTTNIKMFESQEYKPFLSFYEPGEWGLDYGETYFHYCLFKDHVKVLAEFKVGEDYKSHCKDEIHQYTYPFRDGFEDVKVILKEFLLKYLIEVTRAGRPMFTGSSVFTKQEYEDIADEFRKHQENKHKK